MKIGGKTKRKKKLHRHLSLKSFVRKTWLKRFGIHRGFVGRSAPPLAGGWGGRKRRHWRRWLKNTQNVRAAMETPRRRHTKGNNNGNVRLTHTNTNTLAQRKLQNNWIVFLERLHGCKTWSDGRMDEWMARWMDSFLNARLVWMWKCVWM